MANAGIPGRFDAVATGREEAAAVSAVNYLGLVATVHAFWPGLVANGGRVVGVVSVAGTVATPRGAPYAASKHAALAYMRALGGRRAAARGGGAVANPGPVATARLPADPRAGAAGSPAASVISDDRCADGILRALDDGRREVFLPGWWRAAALLQAAFPGTVARAGGPPRRFGAGHRP